MGELFASSSAKPLGEHAVKLLGFGVFNYSQGEAVEYWIAANSWNKTWGEDGYFRIQKGDCGIDTACTAAMHALPCNGRRMHSLMKRREPTALFCAHAGVLDLHYVGMRVARRSFW